MTLEGCSNTEQLTSPDEVHHVRTVHVDTRPSSEIAANGKSTSTMVFATNKIRTARYNKFTFVPRSILVQYTKIGNIFWTIQAVL